MVGIRVVSLTGDSVGTHAVSEVKDLLARDGTLLWVDIPECSDEAVGLLTDVLGCHLSRSATACNEIGFRGCGSIRISSC